MLLQPLSSSLDGHFVEYNVKSLVNGWQAQVDVMAVALQAQGFDD
jgi:hypothetical protein